MNLLCSDFRKNVTTLTKTATGPIDPQVMQAVCLPPHYSIPLALYMGQVVAVEENLTPVVRVRLTPHLHRLWSLFAVTVSAYVQWPPRTDRHQMDCLLMHEKYEQHLRARPSPGNTYTEYVDKSSIEQHAF